MHISRRAPDYPVQFGLLVLHLAGLAGIIYSFYTDFHMVSWILFWFYLVGAGLGITLGDHRMLTHKSFICDNFYIRRMLIYFSGLLQRAQSWVANHRSHHSHTDTERDPHSPYWPYRGGWNGFWWSHIMWLCWKFVPPKRIRNHPDLIYNKDVLWENKWHTAFVASGFLVPFILGGIYGVFVEGWDQFFLYGADSFFLASIRTAILLHIICSINSFGHMLGFRVRTKNDKLYEKDSSRTNPLLALVSFGEGNHGDHHIYPWSARIGKLDPSWPVILFFETLGIFHNVLRPPCISDTPDKKIKKPDLHDQGF